MLMSLYWVCCRFHLPAPYSLYKTGDDLDKLLFSYAILSCSPTLHLWDRFSDRCSVVGISLSTRYCRLFSTLQGSSVIGVEGRGVAGIDPWISAASCPQGSKRPCLCGGGYGVQPPSVTGSYNGSSSLNSSIPDSGTSFHMSSSSFLFY